MKRAVVAAGITYDAGETYLELAHLPIVTVGDVVADTQNNIRYRVRSVTPFTHRTMVISQILSVLRVDENDIIYSIPVSESSNSSAGRGWDLVDRNRPSEQLHDLLP